MAEESFATKQGRELAEKLRKRHAVSELLIGCLDFDRFTLIKNSGGIFAVEMERFEPQCHGMVGPEEGISDLETILNLAMERLRGKTSSNQEEPNE